MDVPPATALAFRVTLPLDQLDTMTTAGLQQDTGKNHFTASSHSAPAWLMLFQRAIVTDNLQNNLTSLVMGSREVLLFHISHKEQLLPPSHCSQG